MIKALLYCTKAKKRFRLGHVYEYEDELYRLPNGEIKFGTSVELMSYEIGEYDRNNFLNGKIVAEVEIDNVDFYEMEYYKNNLVLNQISKYDEFESKWWEQDCFKRVISNENTEEEIANCSLFKNSCLTFEELGSYVCPKDGINNFYALHLTNLKVFDEPKGLSDYYLFDPDYCILKEVKKAPQNMCRVVESHGLIEVPSKQYVLISIQPQHLCNILNGKKTIEVRKQVLNCLKEMCKYDN